MSVVAHQLGEVLQKNKKYYFNIVASDQYSTAELPGHF